jgi:hypothetical protein
MIQAYLRRQKVDGAWQNVQVHDSVLFHVDEGEQLLQVARRDGSTSLGVIRSAWDGETLSTSGAQADTTRMVKHGSYRFVLVIGLQPDFAAAVLADKETGAGTPQRFVWAAAGDPNAPDLPPRFPDALAVGSLPSGPIQVAHAVRLSIEERRRRALKEGGHDDPQETHSTQNQVRLAALLNIACHGGGRVDVADWNLAAELLDNSRQVRQALLDYKTVVEAERQAADARAKVDQQEYRNDYALTQTLTRLAGTFGRAAKRKGEPMRSNELWQSLNSRDRTRPGLKYDVIRSALENRQLVEVDRDTYVAGPNAG